MRIELSDGIRHPVLQRTLPRSRHLINNTIRSRFLAFNSRRNPTFSFHLFKSRIDLALLGSPEMTGRFIHELFEFITRLGFITEEPEQDIWEHALFLHRKRIIYN